jgi:hypothetical protein
MSFNSFGRPAAIDVVVIKDNGILLWFMTKIIEGFIFDTMDQPVPNVQVQTFQKISPFNLF